MARTTERKVIAAALATMIISGLCGLVLMFGHLVGFEPRWLVNIALSGLPIAALTIGFCLVRA